jgi:rare lipoprotein A
VRITNTANDAQVTVTITDRGPYHGNRVTDLSERAAMVAGFHGAGTAHVIGEVLAE